PVSKRTTQIAASTRPSPRWTQRQMRIATVASILVVTVCVLMGLIASAVPPAQPVITPLPKVSSDNVLDYLRRVGVPIADLRTFSVPNKTWDATQEVEFTVNQDKNRGVFVVLSYDTPSRASRDALKVSVHPTFKTWKLMRVSNILLLASPDTADQLI